MKFSLNCQRFLLILGNLFISPPPVSPVAGHQTDNAPLGARLPQGQRFQFIGKHIMNGGTGGTGGRMVGTQIKPRQIMAETTMCRPLEKKAACGRHITYYIYDDLRSSQDEWLERGAIGHIFN